MTVWMKRTQFPMGMGWQLFNNEKSALKKAAEEAGEHDLMQLNPREWVRPDFDFMTELQHHAKPLRIEVREEQVLD